LRVCDVALKHADGAAALDHFSDGAELFLPNGAKEIDLQFESGEGFAVGERGGEGDAHGGVGDVAEDASVQCAHGVRVDLVGIEMKDGFAILNGGEIESDEPGNRGRRDLATDKLLKVVQVLSHLFSLLLDLQWMNKIQAEGKFCARTAAG
jgi:hypothetical protein